MKNKKIGETEKQRLKHFKIKISEIINEQRFVILTTELTSKLNEVNLNSININIVK